jgi:hypothetical protein
MLRVARCGHGEPLFACCAVESSADNCLRGRQRSQRKLEGGAGCQSIKMAKDLFDDLLVFSFTAFGDLGLANRQKLESGGIRNGIARQSFGPLLQCDAGE